MLSSENGDITRNTWEFEDDFRDETSIFSFCDHLAILSGLSEISTYLLGSSFSIGGVSDLL